MDPTKAREERIEVSLQSGDVGSSTVNHFHNAFTNTTNALGQQVNEVDDDDVTSDIFSDLKLLILSPSSSKDIMSS